MTTEVAGRLLIVDDEPTNIEVLVDLLEERFDLLVATDGAQALALATAEPAPDLILLDVMMPGMNGYQVCTRLKDDSRTRHVPVIFITGLGDPEAETKGLAAGAVDYITKPFNGAVVLKRVEVHLELKRARDRLALAATIDGLTGVANRRHFDQVLETESRRLHRAPSARLSLILVDIDHFKGFNDAYGHVAGDDCLRRVARLIGDLVGRGPDTVARYGGAELACILPETDRDGAIALAERIREGIEGLRIPHVASSAAPHVTASLGVATVTRETQGFIDDIVQRADKQRTRAKLAGRNRVMVAEIEEAGGPAFSVPGIDMGAGLSRVRGNTRLYNSLLRSFFDRYRNMGQDFRRLLRSGDLERVRYLAHNMKGVSANLGASDLARAAGALEDVVGSPAAPIPEDVAPVLLRLESRLADVLGGLDHYLAANEGHQGAGGAGLVSDLTKVHAVLAEALARLDHDLGVTLDLLSGVETRLRNSAFKDAFLMLEHYLAEFDIDNARAVLAGMVRSLAGPDGTATAPVAVAVVPSDRPHILVVDDMPENLLILVEALKDHYAISATRSGAHALMLATASPPPDLILMNIVLPGIDGYEVCRRLKQTEATRAIPIIFLTGLESAENEALGLRLGAADYIRKPITYPVLDLRVTLHLALVESQRRLERQNLELHKAAKQREDIDRIIQHDLRTPLNTIISTADHILSGGLPSDDLGDLVGYIRDAGRDMLRLITSTADILRIEAGQLQIDKTRTNLIDIVRAAISDLAVQAAAKSMTVQVLVNGKETGREPIHVFVERTLCRSMFANLIKNAIEAAPAGSAVTVALAGSAEEVTAAVHNPGAIPAAIRSRFFEKYTTHGKPGGTGLGAYSVRLIARAHGGDADFETAEETGTTITVHLPR